MGGPFFQTPGTGDKNSVMNILKFIFYLYYIKLHLKPPGPEKVWNRPPPNSRQTDGNGASTTESVLSGRFSKKKKILE